MITPPADHRETRLGGVGDIELFVQMWRPSSGLRGVVVVVHGIGEHSGRYGFLVERFVAHGFAVVGMDNRGHGRSGGMHGHVNAWSEYREDVHALKEYVRAQFPAIPIFLYGHSLGALIVSDYILFYPEDLAGVILTGHPLIPSSPAKPLLIFLARTLSRYLPKISFKLPVDDDALSRDPEVVRAYGADPLVHRRVTARWGTESLAAIDRVRRRANEIRLPLLILHGGADRIDSVEGSRELFNLASSEDKHLKVYPGGYHEPHNDLDREIVLNDVLSWLTERSAR